MKKNIQIKDIQARSVGDSNGNSTIEVEIETNQGEKSNCMVPVNDPSDVQETVQCVDNTIKEKIVGMNVLEQGVIDQYLNSLGSTQNQSSKIGTSIAVAKAGAQSMNMPFYQYIGGISGSSIPTPMVSLIHGGSLANNNIDIQNFMIIPRNVELLSQQLEMCKEVNHALKEIFQEDGVTPNQDENKVYSPNIRDDWEALDFIMRAILKADYIENMAIAIDIHADRWYQNGKYILPKRSITYTTDELIQKYIELAKRYPILAIEDGLADEDIAGWEKMTKELGNKMHLVGNSLFQTNLEKLQNGIYHRIANSILIDPLQAGTITETIEIVKKAKANGYVPIMVQSVESKGNCFSKEFARALNMKYMKYLPT